MNAHGPATEYGVPVPGGFALTGWCWCGLMFTSRGSTAREARVAMKRAARDHRGQVAAAGPGWRDAA